MTLAENVQTALLRPRRRTHGRRCARPRAAAATRRSAFSTLVGMADQADRLTAEIAYGDVKRLDLALALAGEPRLLLMDEPAAGMSPSERRGLMALTERIARERNMACCSPSTTWTWCSVTPTACWCSTAAS